MLEKRVRKGRKIEGTNTINEKYYVCSAQGKRGKRNTGKMMKVQEDTMTEESTSSKSKKRRERRVMITRTDCGASIRVKMNEEGQFEIIHHIMAHNHPLTRQPLNYLHRSKRRMT